MAEESTKRRRGASRASSVRGGNSAPSNAEEPRAKVLALEVTMLKIMGIVGEGHHLFVAGVSKNWRGLYDGAHPGLKTSLRRSLFGSVECLNWAIKHGCIELGMDVGLEIFEAAARFGDVSVCQTLHHHGCPWDEKVCEAAGENAKHGLSILKWLRSEDLPDKRPCPWNENTCSAAVYRGDVDMLTWLLSDEANAPFEVTSNLLYSAVREGRITMLEILLAQPSLRTDLEAGGEGGMWRDGAFFAAVFGRLEVLRCLHANARDLCVWDGVVCYGAVTNAKSLEMLQWLRSESVMCPWDMFSCPEVLLHKGRWDGGRDDRFEEIKQWVHANGHPCDCED